MKKVFVFFVVFVILCGLLPEVKADDVPAGKRKLLVTAYYSPLPGQSFYIRGSLEADQHLNGRGTNGADGTEVFTGMLAAPSIYPFGTRVLVPELGVGEVHDRGGAILANADYDRIDVWMGRGEEGLARAVNWGARLIEGEVYDSAAEIQVNLDFSSVSAKLSEGFIARLQARSDLSQSYAFSKPAEKATQEDIKDLQVSLTLFGFYNGPIDGEMSSTIKDAILMFQLEEGIVADAKSPGAGNFGPVTQGKLHERVASYDAERVREEKRFAANRMLLVSGLGKSADGAKVEALQRTLWDMGFYLGPISRKYDAMTIDAVFTFQQSQGILNSAYETGAGYYGKKTHEALIAALDLRIERLKEYPKEMQTWIPAKLPLPKLANLSPVTEMPAIVSLNFDLALTKKE